MNGSYAAYGFIADSILRFSVFEQKVLGVSFLIVGTSGNSWTWHHTHINITSFYYIILYWATK